MPLALRSTPTVLSACRNVPLALMSTDIEITVWAAVPVQLN